MRFIDDYILNPIPYMLCALPFLALFRIFAVKRLRKHGERTTAAHEILLGIFMLFLVALASRTIIPRFEFGNTAFGIASPTGGGISLIPGLIIWDSFHEWKQTGSPFYFITNLIGNIGVFVPIGFFLPLLWKDMPRKKIVLIAFLGSLFIELCQLPQARWTDVDDLWLNTLGGLLGYELYRLFVKVFPKLKTKFLLTKYSRTT